MFPTWRLKIREAQIALNAGRPDEAGQILQQASVRDFLPAKRLSDKVAAQLVSRAEQRFQQGDSVASWSDLQQAARLGGCEGRVAELRQAQAERGLEQVRSLLVQGETRLAAAQIARLEQRRLGGDQRRAWKLIVHLVSRAKELSDQGRATAAAEMLERAARLLPDPGDELAEMFTARQAQLRQQTEDLRSLAGQLHQAVSQAAWTEVLTTAEALLELAPAHTAARQARTRAWNAVGMQATRIPPVSGRRTYDQRNSRLARSLQSTHAWTSSAKADTKAMHTASSQRESGQRLITWIDGVGGYLICLGDEVMLGQPGGSDDAGAKGAGAKGAGAKRAGAEGAGAGAAEIPILADLSRRHASIRREGEAYVISPIHRVRVEGVELSGPLVLSDGVLIELGDTVRLRFRKPHALSGTAVLALESHHKTEPAVDGIVLMSESCVLGSQPQSHIRCRDWTDDLVLFRRGEDLRFRTTANVAVDGEPTSGLAKRGAAITGNTRIDGESFALSFEEV